MLIWKRTSSWCGERASEELKERVEIETRCFPLALRHSCFPHSFYDFSLTAPDQSRGRTRKRSRRSCEKTTIMELRLLAERKDVNGRIYTSVQTDPLAHGWAWNFILPSQSGPHTDVRSCRESEILTFWKSLSPPRTPWRSCITGRIPSRMCSMNMLPEGKHTNSSVGALNQKLKREKKGQK